MAKENVNRLQPRPSSVSVTTLQEKESHRLSAVGAVAGNESDPSLLTTGSSVAEGILTNSTPNGLISTRTVHMQPRITVNNHLPQYGNFYTGYDPMTGARTAVVLGSLLLLLVFYIIYKAKCHKDWSDEDDFYLQQYKQRQAKKALNEQQQQQPQTRRGTHYVIDPVCSPDPTILAATAKWIQMQPLEDAVPAAGPREKRKKSLALSKYLSFSAENINRQLLHGPPLIPNGHGPPPSGEDSDRERSCNEYVPNGFLKYIHKEGLHGPDWSYNDTQDSDGERGPVEFYIEEDERHHRRRASSHDEHMYTGDHEVEKLFSVEEQNPRKKSRKHQLEHFSSLDRHNNNDELEDRTLQLNPDVDVCTNCMSDRNSSVGIIQDQPPRTSLYLPPDREILLTPTPRRSRLRSRPKQRSQDRASLESHQRSIEDDSPDFSVSILPARDVTGLSLDMTSSSETTAEHQIVPSTITTVPMLSYIDNLANNSTFSTMSTATASSNGSYQSEGQDIPMTDLALPLVHGTILTPQPKQTVVEVSIETALASSSKPNDQDDTKL